MTGELVFLTVYAALCAGLALATAFAWRGARPGRAHDALCDVEIAALNGGARLAVVTALTALRADHVTVTADGGLVAGHPPPVDAGEVEAELFEAVRRAPERRGAEVVDEAVDGAAVQRVLTKLVGDGLLLDERAAARMRVLWLRAVWLATCGAAGLAALAAAGTGEPHARAAIAGTVLSMVCVACWIGRRRSGPTAAGRRLLGDAVPERGEESRAVRRGLPFAVATLGSAALWSTDPDYATALELPAEIPTGVDTMTYAAAANCGGGCGGGCGCG